MNLLPCPRVLERGAGFFLLPRRATLRLDRALQSPAGRPIISRLQSAATSLGVSFTPFKESCPGEAHVSFVREMAGILDSASAASRGEGYVLRIRRRGITVGFREPGGANAAVATVRQLFREHGRRLPCLRIADWPDFPRRGVMLDVSRGRVPRIETLLELVDQLADFKINEFQLYIEHTFAYRGYKPVWRDWGALTGREMQRLDARCRALGIDLVPNQNSFGHLREWLEYPPLKQLAEVPAAYESPEGGFLRRPSTLAPGHPGTLPFLRGLYDELLRHFSSRRFNIGCDETWDLGRGQSKARCARKGKGRVYLAFLRALHREVAARGRRMMFWGDIILHYPELIDRLPRDVIALNWGYEAAHPFVRETAAFAKSGIPFYVCPGTSTWMTLIGRHDNALANLCAAAQAGRKHGAQGYLITDWGDGGHPQPLAVSYLPYLAGASLSWCADSFEARLLRPVLSRDVFGDPTGRLARIAWALGLAHRRFAYTEANATPFGTVIAAPPPPLREGFCRNGLSHYLRIPAKRVRAALNEVESQRAAIRRSRPKTDCGRLLAVELDMAARMAAESCRFMLWQQALAHRRLRAARELARVGIAGLRRLERDLNAYWPVRNKGDTRKSAAFLRWRAEDYLRGTSPVSPAAAGGAVKSGH